MDFLSVIDSTWLYAALALLAGCTIQTAVGFGMALIAAPIIVMINPLWVPYVLTVTALALSLGNTWNQRHDIQWEQLVPPMISRIPGTVIGTWVLALIAVQWLQVIVAVMVLLTIFVTMRMKPFASTPFNMGVAGFVSGITGTTTGIGGPPMALVMQHSEGKHARANLSVYFVFSCVVSLIGYMWAGLMSPDQWVVSITMIPVAISGFYLGKVLRPWVDNRFRPVLLFTCGVSATVALVNVFFW